MKVGYLFPGQGSQFVGMGKDIFEKHDAARGVFERADRVLGYELSKICFEGPEEELTRTLYAQPAIFVTSLAYLAVLQESIPGIEPSMAAGLSLGEWTSLVAAGSIDFEDGLKLVHERADAMEKAARASQGSMASILGLTQAECETLAESAGCQVANLNSPEQTVLSGSIESIEKACTLAEEMNAKRAIPLKVGGAFHSRLMKPAEEQLRKALEQTPIRTPACLFIPNAEAAPVSDPEKIRELLALQLTSPVRWVETMVRADEAKMDFFLEIGPGRVLKGLARKSPGKIAVESCGTVADIVKTQEVLSQLKS